MRVYYGYSIENTIIKEMDMSLDELRTDVARKQKKGLPFIGASVVIWLLILITCSLSL